MGNKVICYARCSTSEQFKSSLGIEAQIEDMRRFAHRNGLEIVDIRREVVSGKHDLDRRPVLKQAFEDAAKIKGCSVLTSKIDRLSRSQLFINKLVATNVNFITAETGLDCSPLEISLRAAFAEEERRKIGDRTKAAFAAKKVRGEPMGMHLDKVAEARAKAIEHSVMVNKKEADAFAEFMREKITDFVDLNLSLTQMAARLNKYKTPTQRGGKWYPTTVKNLIDRLQLI
jgi:DNA invertase Pin-like site-specific DNA recombinase